MIYQAGARFALGLEIAMTIRLLTEHPASVGESYGGHMLFAFRFGGSMILGGLACLIHGLLPFCFTTSGSRRVRALHAMLGHSRRQVRYSEPPREAAEAFNWTI